jgi:DUF1365 family protein
MTDGATPQSMSNINNKLESGLYQGSISHKRFTPKVHEFSYNISMMGLVLDELNQITQKSKLLGTKWYNPVRFVEKDYIKSEPGELKQRISSKVQRLGGDWDGSKVLMLVQCRCLGLYFSPINLYYCFNKDNECNLMLAEVSNTPWNEKHYYLVDITPKSGGDKNITEKKFHVSPFMEMNMNYHWNATVPNKKAFVNIQNFDLSNTTKVFEANMKLEKKSINSMTLLASWLSLPFTAIKIVSLIYWQAAKLFIKRIPFVNYQKH